LLVIQEPKIEVPNVAEKQLPLKLLRTNKTDPHEISNIELIPATIGTLHEPPTLTKLCPKPWDKTKPCGPQSLYQQMVYSDDL